jgi:hypothetical protein
VSEVFKVEEIDGVGEGQEIIKLSIYRHSWKPFWRTSRQGLFTSTAELSEFLEYQYSD